jgi:hypothetical protein
MHKKNDISNFGQSTAREETMWESYTYLEEIGHEDLDLIQLA